MQDKRTPLPLPLLLWLAPVALLGAVALWPASPGRAQVDPDDDDAAAADDGSAAERPRPQPAPTVVVPPAPVGEVESDVDAPGTIRVRGVAVAVRRCDNRAARVWPEKRITHRRRGA